MDDRSSPTRRRRFLAALGATALAGCSGLGGDPGGSPDGAGEEPSQTPSSSPSPSPTPTATGTPVPADGDASGSTPPSPTPLSPTPATAAPTVDTPSTDDPLLVGVLAPDPESFPMGRSMVAGARIAAERLADDRGPTGPPVELRVGNTEGSPGTGREEFRRLVREEGVDAVVGTYVTQVTLQCFQPMKAEETPLITTGASGPKPARVVNERYDEFRYHFRPGPLNTHDLGTATVSFLADAGPELGLESASLLVENSAPLDGYAERLAERLQTAVTVTGSRRPSTGTTNWTPLFNEIESEGADLVLIGQSLTGVGAVEAWHDQKRPFALGGLSGPLQATDAWGTTEGAAEGAFTLMPFTPRTRVGPGANAFVTSYLDRFGDQPEFTGAHTHDAVLALAAAARDAGSRDGEALVEALESVRVSESAVFPGLSFRGPDAEYAHDPSWDGIESGVPQVAQWQGGSLVPFYPEAAADGDYRPPPWRR